MNSRSWMLFAALLTGPLHGWAQESPENPSAAAPLVFDLGNPEIRNIVRQNAQTQYAPVVRVNEEKTSSQSLEDIFITEVEVVEAPPVTKQAAHPIELPSPVEGLLSAIFETVLDEALEELVGEQDTVWLSCEGRDMLEASRVKYEKCPGRGMPPHNAPEAQLPQVR